MHSLNRPCFPSTVWTTRAMFVFISCADMLMSRRILRVSVDWSMRCGGHRCRASHHMTYFVCIPDLYKMSAFPELDNNPKYQHIFTMYIATR